MKNPLILREAANYFHQHTWKTIIIKFGWEIIDNPHFDNLILDISILRSLNINIILVFGAWKQITKILQDKWIEFEIKDWIRQTNLKAAIEVNKLCLKLANTVSKKFHKLWFEFDYMPEILTSYRISHDNYTAKIDHVCIKKIRKAFKENKIILVWASHQTKAWVYTNVNADEVALWMGKKVKPYKFIFLTSTDWVLDENWKLITTLTKKESKRMIKKWYIHWWMKVKVETCLKALKYTKRVHMISWVKDGKLLEELFTDEWSGTMIVNEKKD